jgi:hypothetical protein
MYQYSYIEIKHLVCYCFAILIHIITVVDARVAVQQQTTVKYYGLLVVPEIFAVQFAVLVLLAAW